VSADYLQTSAIIDRDGSVCSAVNDPNRYSGPGSGYQLDGERWRKLQALPHELDPRTLAASPSNGARPLLAELGPAAAGDRANEVIVAVGPAFGDALRETIVGLRHEEVLAALVAGAREAGAEPRLVRIRSTSDVAFIGHEGALLSGSGVAVGLQSKGTAVIHRRDLQPLDNLELFGMAPLLTLDSYQAIGRNAAGYALGRSVGPVPTQLDNFARAKLIVLTTLLHARETACVERGASAVEVALA
jgi:hypothetical protein